MLPEVFAWCVVICWFFKMKGFFMVICIYLTKKNDNSNDIFTLLTL